MEKKSIPVARCLTRANPRFLRLAYRTTVDYCRSLYGKLFFPMLLFAYRALTVRSLISSYK